MIGARVLAMCAIAIACAALPSAAQIHGNVSVMFDVLPDISDAPGRQAVTGCGHVCSSSVALR